jgi:hypothetical protein
MDFLNHLLGGMFLLSFSVCWLALKFLKSSDRDGKIKTAVRDGIVKAITRKFM